MKKLIFGLLIFNISQLFAAGTVPDSKTTGSLGLLQPSTTTVDPNRSWGDKLNKNWQIVDSTVSGIFGSFSAIGTDTTTLFTTINSTAVQLSNYINSANSTMTALSVATSAITAISVSTTIISNQESPDISNRTYFLHSESSGGAGSSYFLILSSPAATAEVTKTQTITSANGLVMISSHITLTSDPGVTKIQAGVWSFTSWASASNISSLDQLIISVATCAIDGSVITEVVSTTETINDINIDRFDTFVIQQNDVFMSTSDRILVRYFVRTNSLVGVTMSLAYAGTTHASHLSSPIGSVYKFTQLSDAPSTLVGSGNKYVVVNNDQTSLTFFGSTTSSSGGGTSVATVAGSTQTLVLKVPTAFISTISVCGIPAACYSWGPSSASIVGIWADAYAGSTVGWTKIDILISTGGVGGLPLAPNRFLPLSLSTASSLGLSAYSGFVSTIAIINPGEWIGVGISSMAVSGRVTQGMAVHLDYWERGRY